MSNAIELERWAIGGLLAGLPIEGRPIQIVIPACSGNDDLVIAEATAGPGDDMDVIMERARLIAAAPDLLALLEEFVRPLDEGDYASPDPDEFCDECGAKREKPGDMFCTTPGCIYPRVRAAIAKAKGK